MTMPGGTYIWDTCVLRRWLTEQPHEYVDRIHQHLEDANNGITKLYFSTMILAEGQLAGSAAGALDDFEKDIRQLSTLIDPNPDIMKIVGRLRTFSYNKSPVHPKTDPKSRALGLGDAIHLATAVWLQRSAGVADLIFHTFDDGNTKQNGERFAPLLSFQDWCHGIDNDPDVRAVINLKRKKPNHPNMPVLA